PIPNRHFGINATPTPSRRIQPTSSPLAEGPGDLLAQRLEQVLQGRARIGLDEDLRGHAGQQVKVAKPLGFSLRQRYAHKVIGLGRRGSARLVAREVGGAMNQDSVE